MSFFKTTLKAFCAGVLALAFSVTALQAAEDKIVHVYNWSDYIGESTLKDFEAETGIKVVYDMYDASETVDAKLLAGKSGYDVVLHAGSFTPKLFKAGIFQALDKSKLPNWKHMDEKTLKILENWDPGNKYSAPYMWGTVGVTYNSDMVKARVPNAPVTSLDMMFKPEYASKLADCGISVLESPTDIIPMALAYLGKDPNSEDPKDYDAVVELFKPVREYIKVFDSANYLNAIPNKELCMVFSWSGDYATASTRASEAKIDINLEYHVPVTGVPAWFDVWLIPDDAPHPDNAHKFINFLMRPDVIAKCTNYTYYANTNKDAAPLVLKEVLEDPAIYPNEDILARMWTAKTLSKKALRARTRAWSRIKTGS